MKGFQVVKISDIIYCQASSNYTFFNFTDQPAICASKPINEYETLLEDCNFVRVHKSSLINLAHVREYQKGDGGRVVLTGGQEVEVSRRRKEILMARMKEYFRF